MAVLPTVGGSVDTWGTELNDWLLVGHDSDGTPKTPSKATYTIYKTTSGSFPLYYARDQGGTLITSSADTATTSGLKAVLGTLLPQFAHDITIQFLANTRYHFLDAPLGNESWAGVEDHINFAQLENVTIIGGGWSTILSNRSNWPTGTDVETWDFTNSHNIMVRDMSVECCGSLKSTTGAIDFDQGVNCRVFNVRIKRTRGAQGIVADGGDAGKYAGRNIFSHVYLQGRPQPPQLDLLSGGSLASTTEYRYCVSWVDMDLNGANTAGETRPSVVQSMTTTSTSKSIQILLDIGAYTVTQRKIYRWDSTNGWRLLTTINDNTTTRFTDDGTLTPSAATFAVGSTIMGSGIELLSNQDSIITNCVADGVGDKNVGINQYGFNIVRKGSITPSSRNQINNCLSIGSGSYGMRIAGGSNNKIIGSTVVNPGIAATKAAFYRIEGVTFATDYNSIIGCHGVDTQDANSPTGGATTSNAVSIAGTPAPNKTLIDGCSFQGYTTAATPIADGGTNTVLGTNVT